MLAAGTVPLQEHSIGVRRSFETGEFNNLDPERADVSLQAKQTFRDLFGNQPPFNDEEYMAVVERCFDKTETMVKEDSDGQRYRATAIDVTDAVMFAPEHFKRSRNRAELHDTGSLVNVSTAYLESFASKIAASYLLHDVEDRDWETVKQIFSSTKANYGVLIRGFAEGFSQGATSAKWMDAGIRVIGTVISVLFSKTAFRTFIDSTNAGKDFDFPLMKGERVMVTLTHDIPT